MIGMNLLITFVRLIIIFHHFSLKLENSKFSFRWMVFSEYLLKFHLINEGDLYLKSLEAIFFSQECFHRCCHQRTDPKMQLFDCVRPLIYQTFILLILIIFCFTHLIFRTSKSGPLIMNFTLSNIGFSFEETIWHRFSMMR